MDLEKPDTEHTALHRLLQTLFRCLAFGQEYKLRASRSHGEENDRRLDALQLLMELATCWDSWLLTVAPTLLVTSIRDALTSGYPEGSSGITERLRSAGYSEKEIRLYLDMTRDQAAYYPPSPGEQ